MPGPLFNGMQPQQPQQGITPGQAAGQMGQALDQTDPLMIANAYAKQASMRQAMGDIPAPAPAPQQSLSNDAAGKRVDQMMNSFPTTLEELQALKAQQGQR